MYTKGGRIERECINIHIIMRYRIKECAQTAKAVMKDIM